MRICYIWHFCRDGRRPRSAETVYRAWVCGFCNMAAMGWGDLTSRVMTGSPRVGSLGDKEEAAQLS